MKKPNYDWDETNNLILRYKYPDFMPKGIVTKFIVVMNQWIDGKWNHQENKQYVWKNGVVLKKEQTRAEIIEYYGKREIRIRVSGKLKRDLMTQIIYELDKINNSFNRLNYQKLVPCNCSICKDSQSPHFYSFEILRKFVADNQGLIQCQNSYQMVNVLSLIDDTIDIDQLNSKNIKDSNNYSAIDKDRKTKDKIQVQDYEQPKILRDDKGNLVIETKDQNFFATPIEKDVTATAASTSYSISKGTAALMTNIELDSISAIFLSLGEIFTKASETSIAGEKGRFISGLGTSQFFRLIKQELSQNGYVYLKLEAGNQVKPSTLANYVAIPAIRIPKQEKVYKLVFSKKYKQNRRDIFDKVMKSFKSSANWLIYEDFSYDQEEISYLLLSKREKKEVDLIRASDFFIKTFNNVLRGY